MNRIGFYIVALIVILFHCASQSWNTNRVVIKCHKQQIQAINRLIEAVKESEKVELDFIRQIKK